MKILIAAMAVVLYTAGASMVYAQGCHKTCADGFSYSKEAGKCVKKSISS